MGKKNPRSGSNFDDFLKEEGIYEDVQNTAIKKVLSAKLEAAMIEKKISKTEMAKRLKTSRTQLNRLLDPDNAAGPRAAGLDNTPNGEQSGFSAWLKVGSQSSGVEMNLPQSGKNH